MTLQDAEAEVAQLRAWYALPSSGRRGPGLVSLAGLWLAFALAAAIVGARRGVTL